MIQNSLIRRIYLYSFAFLGLILMVIGAVRLLDLGLKVYVFRQADQYAIYPDYPHKLAGEATPSAVDEESRRIREEEARAQNTTSQRQSAASSSIAMIIVGLPLFFYHWRKVNKVSD